MSKSIISKLKTTMHSIELGYGGLNEQLYKQLSFRFYDEQLRKSIDPMYAQLYFTLVIPLERKLTAYTKS